MINKVSMSSAIIFAFIFTLGLTTSIYPAHAQTNTLPPLKVAVMNFDTVRAQSNAFKKAATDLSKYVKSLTAALEGEEKDLREGKAQLDRKRTLLAPDAYDVERKKHQNLVEKFQRKRQSQQEVVNKIRDSFIKTISEKIVKIMQGYAVKHNITLVIPDQMVLLNAEHLNINGAILSELNTQLPAVALDVPAQ